MNPVSTILPIKGVPDELIQILNDRFRQLSTPRAAGADGSEAGYYFPHANRRDANATPVGTLGTEIDRTVVYQVQTVKASQVWVYVSGIMRADFADRPTDLGANDAGFLWQVLDYAHLLRWTGTGWEFLDEMGGYVALRTVTPDGNGWQLCDGTATHYLHISAGVASEVSYTTIALTSGAYPKFAAAAGIGITSSSPPGTTTNKALINAAGGTFLTSVDGSAQPPHYDLLPYFRR